MDIRIDKFLWLVRIYKTRTLASDACVKGQVLVAGSNAKPSRMVKIGDRIDIKRNSILYSFKILDIPRSRLGAKLVDGCLQNITDASQLAILDLIRLEQKNQRAKGLGRPTKKERRVVDAMFSNQYISDNDGWEL